MFQNASHHKVLGISRQAILGTRGLDRQTV
jgi:hypothetical protein